jgi:hypothetical protein
MIQSSASLVDTLCEDEPRVRARSLEPRPLAVRFVDAAARARLGGAGTLVVRVEKLTVLARGRLCEVIDDAMERELAARGATSPGIGSSQDPDASLSDQLFRARQVGVYRVCVALGPLGLAASPSGALQAEDARTLLFLAEATTERPLELVLDASDEHAGVFLTPVPLRDALARLIPETPKATVPTADAATAEATAEAPKLESMEPTTERTLPLAAASVDEPIPSATVPAPALEPAVRLSAPEPVPAPAGLPKELASVMIAPVHAAIEKHLVGVATSSFDEASWRHWTLALHAAKGPQPLANFEKLFTESYVPLCDAVDHGLSDSRAVHARDEFRASFSRMYTEACPAFGVTGKRPKMVFDAPDIAGRMARSLGARTVQLLLVSSMRFDIGKQVRDSLAERAEAAARGKAGVSVTDRLLLWSALPTTTSRQLDCLTRGAQALCGPLPSERDLDAVRGRTVDTIRRVKIGSRDVFKLDTCEAKVGEAGAGASNALPRVAELLEHAIVKHAEKLAPRTLLFVFGDHGFTIDGGGTAKAGGATPEEVLVPAFALLVGDHPG